jgi:hypothetical protein
MAVRRMIVFITLALTSCSSVGWQLLNVESSPPLLADGMAIYNTTDSYAILFGGVTSTNQLSDQTWKWDGKRWLQMSPDEHPGARSKQAMAYDPARNTVVLFGGWDGKAVFNDTWEWDGAEWKNIKPEHQPTARCCHAMAYDENLDKVILYGGWDNTKSIFYNDVWTWDGVDWEEMDSTGLPLMSGHTMAEFPEQDEVVSISSTRSVNTWVFRQGKWMDLGINPIPTRSEGRSAYDASNQWIVYFGGIKDGEFQNDTWIFDGTNWHLLSLTSSPSGRFGHVMFYDPTREAVILFGGIDSSTYYNDTWALRLPRNIPTLSAPPTSTQVFVP